MVHTFYIHNKYFALDTESGALHILDEKAYEMIHSLRMPLPCGCPDVWVNRWGNDAKVIWSEIQKLIAAEQLFIPESKSVHSGEPCIKALCLHVAHDCNLRCAYCFAGDGAFGAERSVMTSKTAKKAVDFLIKQSGNRRHLEIDFFGGEPLLAWDTVQTAVAYGKKRAAETGKVIRFTLTTNGLALDDEKIEYINAEIDNAVLSVDGREHVHDALRKTVRGEGSYHAVLPKFLQLIKNRTKDYYVRGTFTALNIDFADDVLALYNKGFRHISMEPAVLPDAHPLALRAEHKESIISEYRRLQQLLRRHSDIDFFHFKIDLDTGPCVYKRVKGCGAGTEYAAVTPEGELYPCHQFVGINEYKMGSIDDFDSQAVKPFGNIYTRTECIACWAKYFCGGGCAAANLTVNGDAERSYELGCDLARVRFECAMAGKCSDNTNVRL
jgi:uncharacterized protein